MDEFSSLPNSRPPTAQSLGDITLNQEAWGSETNLISQKKNSIIPIANACQDLPPRPVTRNEWVEKSQRPCPLRPAYVFVIVLAAIIVLVVAITIGVIFGKYVSPPLTGIVMILL